MSPVVSRAELEWEEWDRGRFRQRHAPLGDRVGAVKLGYNLQETAPGRASVPYHAHRVNEELIVHLEGEAWVRLDGAEHRLAPGTVVALPAGPDSAHQIVNRSDRPVLSLLASTRFPWDWIDYPDSEKNMVRVEALAGDTPAIRRMLRGERAVEITPEGYLEGEPVDEPLGPPPAGEAPRDPRIVAFEEVEWQANEWGPFRSERRRLAWVAGARRLGFGLFLWGNDDGAGPRKYELMLEGARFCDRNGFDAVWTPERHFHAFGGLYPQPAITGAAVAAVTKRVPAPKAQAKPLNKAVNKKEQRLATLKEVGKKALQKVQAATHQADSKVKAVPGKPLAPAAVVGKKSTRGLTAKERALVKEFERRELSCQLLVRGNGFAQQVPYADRLDHRASACWARWRSSSGPCHGWR